MSGVATLAREPAIASRSECEDFLYHEAALLDEWRLDEWFDLFAPGATYEVPTAGAPDDADAASVLFYIADDHDRLRHRVARLKKPDAHSEWPRSDGARVISNVRTLGSENGELAVASIFVTYRSKNHITDCFFGHHLHRLVVIDGSLKIAAKRTMLDMTSLRPQGRISIIL